VHLVEDVYINGTLFFKRFHQHFEKMNEIHFRPPNTLFNNPTIYFFSISGINNPIIARKDDVMMIHMHTIG